MQDRLKPFLVLLLAELAAFRLYALSCGFYHDDWIFLEMLQTGGGGFWGAAKVFAAKGHWLRPVQILQLPLFYLGALPFPPAGQAILAALELCEGLLLYLLFERLGLRKGMALCAAALALLFPNRDVVHFWLSNASQLLAHALALGAFLIHLDYIDRRGLARLLAGQALFLAAVLTYESAAFLFLLPACAALFEGKGSPRRAAADYWPFAATLALAVLWQRLGARLLLGAENPKVMAFSLGHFLRVFAAGLECSSNRALHNGFKALTWLWPAPWPMLGLWAGASLLLAWPLGGWEGPAPSRRRVAGMLLGGLLGAYLPYALSQDYTPTANGVMSRTSAAGAWAGGLLAAWGLSWLRSVSARRAACAAAAALFLAADWKASWAWAESWRTQLSLLGEVARKIETLPDPVTVLVRGAPSYIGPAVVFDAHYDLDSALRLSTGRKGTHATMLTRRIFLVPDGVEERAGAVLLRKYGYEGLVLYDYAGKTLTRMPDMESALKTLL